MESMNGIGAAAALFLSVVCSTADLHADEASPFHADWGPNLLAAKNGCVIQKAVNTVTQGKNAAREYGPTNLIDGKAAAGKPYSAFDLRAGPAVVVLELKAPATIRRFVLLNDSSNKGGRAAREISIAVSSDKKTWEDVHTHILTKTPDVQSIELEKPVTASAVRLTIQSGYMNGFAILEEFAAFGAGSPDSGIFRGTEEHDVMELRNGDALTGQMLNETLELQTSYARMSFRREEIASLVVEGALASIERITVLNGDVFHGILLDRAIKFQLSTGQRIEIRREKINRLGIRIGPDEKEEYPSHDVIILKNGTRFSGKVQVPQITMQTSYATVPTNTADIAFIEFLGKGRIVTKVTLRNKNTMQGMLAEEDIKIDLDFGPEILVYQDRIAKISFHQEEKTEGATK